MRILFIGNRTAVLQTLLEKGFELDLYALENSYLHRFLEEKGIFFQTFSMKEKAKIIDKVTSKEFDVLVTNGCPFILPVVNSKMYNVHPTYLPHLKGKTPLNGVFYKQLDFYGATCHQIDSGVDTGPIVYQEKKALTQDIDLGLLYYLSFKLEGTVFKKALAKLQSTNFKLPYKQENHIEGSSFNRTSSHSLIDFHAMNTNELMKRIRAFGIKSQGSRVINNGLKLPFEKVFDAEVIQSTDLLKEAKFCKVGEVFLAYDEKFLIKTIDGMIKVTRYE